MKNLPTGEDPEDRIAPEGDINIDGDYPDSLFDDRTGEVQLKKLKQRITTLSIVVSCLLCVMLLVGYLDLRYRVSHIQAAGSKTVQTLSEDIVDKIESLSYQYETLDASLTKALAGMKQSLTLIKDRVTKNEQALEDLMAVSKTGEKALSSLEGNIAGHKDFLDELEKELGGRLDDDASILTALQNDLMAQRKEIAHLTEGMETIQKDAQIQETAIRHLLESKVDEQTLDHSLEEERASHEERMLLLDEKLKSLVEELSWLGKRVDVLQLSVNGQGPQASVSEGVSGAGSKALSPQGIEEQEITE